MRQLHSGEVARWADFISSIVVHFRLMLTSCDVCACVCVCLLKS